MGLFRSLRRLSSPLFGWARNNTPTSQEPEELFDALARWIYGASRPPIMPDAEQRVAALEARYGVRLPEDFRRYLLEVLPLEEIVDDELTTWWPIDRIRNIPDEFEHDVTNPDIAAEAGAYLFFADYCFWCWAWAICCSDGPNRGRIAFIGGPDGFVADSFHEFVERYLNDPLEVASNYPP